MQILSSPSQKQFLENRLVLAFLAGAKAQEKIINEKMVLAFKKFVKNTLDD